MASQHIVSAYYFAWVDGDRDAARGFLADKLKFRSPQDNFDSADEFFNACWQYSEHFNSFEPVQQVFMDETAYIAYPAGEIYIGEFIRIAEGRITEIYVTFGVTV